MRCPACDTANPAAAMLCLTCGAPLHGRCPQCGAALPGQALFCPQCAAPLGTAESPGSALPSQAERRVVTALFCDLKGSTAMAEQLDPEAWAEVMDGAFEQMIGPVYRYDGLVVRLLGDAILAFFGAPQAHENDPERAVLAGLEIIAGIQAYRATVHAQYGLSFDARIGINTGLVVAGAIGTAERREYTIMGDTVNVAARMEQTAQPGTVQIAEPTYKLIAPLFEIEELGGVIAKGKSEPVQAYRVHGRKVQPGRLRGIVGLDAPLVGRQTEVSAFQAVAGRVRAGLGQIVCLIGDAGLGKSRLVGEWRGWWQQTQPADQPPQWTESRGNALDVGYSYEQWSQHLLALLASDDFDPPGVVRGKLTALVDRLAPALSAALRYALEVVVGVERSVAPAGLQGEALKRAVFDASAQIWRAVAQQPAVLVFDDLHWADLPSLELLQRLLGLVRDCPLLLICVFRPDRTAPVWALKEHIERTYSSQLTILPLVPLDAPISNQLISGLLTIPDFPQRVRTLIVDKAEGNPFYTEEVIRTLIDGGQLLHDDERGRWYLSPQAALDELTIPDTLQGLLAARIDRLPEAPRRILQLAAVIGRTFELRVLAELAGHPPDLTVQLAALQEADLVQPLIPGVEYVFKHGLTQEAAYASILLRSRREYHRQVATTLEALFADQLEEQAAVLAFHWGQAEADESALRYAQQAAARAARIYANHEAARLYEQASRAAVRLDRPGAAITALYAAWGRALELDGQYDAAVAAYQELAALALARADSVMECAAVAQLAVTYTNPSSVYNLDAAEPLLARGLALARQIGDPAQEALLLWSTMGLHGSRGRAAEAQAAGEAAIALARQHNLQERLAFALNDLALNLRLTSSPDLARADRYAREARALFRALDNLPMLADNLSQQALHEYLQLELPAALAHAAEAQEIGQRIGNTWGQSFAAMVQGLVRNLTGEWRAAQLNWQEAQQLGRDAGFILATTLIPTWHGALLRAAGQIAAAQALHGAAWQVAEQSAPPMLGEIEFNLALDAFAAGDAAGGNEWLDAAQSRPRIDRGTPAAVLLALAAVQRSRTDGRWDTALALLDAALAELAQVHQPVYSLELRLAQAQTLLAIQKWAEARQTLERLAPAVAALAPLAWQCQAALAQCHARLGHAAAAQAALAAALAAVEQLAAQLDGPAATQFRAHAATRLAS